MDSKIYLLKIMTGLYAAGYKIVKLASAVYFLARFEGSSGAANQLLLPVGAGGWLLTQVVK